MTFVSHAQNFEDVLLWRALRHVEQGRYIDIGAHDPFVDSVSLAFYEAGWRGISVEPTPQYAARLREARVGETVVEAAVADTPGPISFYELSGLSSGRPDVAEHHARSGHQSREILVSTVRLEQLLEMSTPDVHWLKIDVEGMEAEVLRSWRDCPIRPWVLVIEATFPNTQEPTEHLWIDEVLRRGYEKVFFDGLSCYFVHQSHPELISSFAAPANVFDAYSITTGHYSAAKIREELESSRALLADEHARTEQLGAALSDAQRNFEAASLQTGQALERLAVAAKEHRAEVEALNKSLKETEYRLRETSDALGQARVESARLEERSLQLQDKLDRTDASLLRAEAHISDLQAKADIADRQRDQAQADLESFKRDSALLRSTLNREIELLRMTVARANSLFMSAAAEPVGRWHLIGEFLGVARPQAAQRALASWAVSFDGASQNQTNDIKPQVEGTDHMPISAPIQARNPYLRANSLDELLSWHDIDFVRCAYVTILGRQPDSEGETYYADRVRRGYSKKHILWQLRTSREGPRHDPGIAGLDRALRRARRARIPILGALFRVLNAEEGDSGADRRQRAIANEIGLLRSAHELELYRLQVVTSTLQRLESRMQIFEGRLAGTSADAFGNDQAAALAFGDVTRCAKRELTDPIDLSPANSPDETIGILKAAINKSREVEAFRVPGRTK